MQYSIYKIILLNFLVFTLFFCIAACERRSADETNLKSYSVNIHTSGELKKVKKKDNSATIFLDVQDETGQMPVTPVILKSLLEGDNFKIVDSPSKAAYILHIAILQEGRTNPENLEDIVDKGYGTAASFTGGDSSGWVADALLVKRRVPQEKRESHERLKNISSRNALENSQMRIGLETRGNLHNREEHLAVFGRPLARALHAALTGREDKGFSQD